MAFFALLATRRGSMDFWPKLTAGREWLLLGLYFDRLNYRYWPEPAVATPAALLALALGPVQLHEHQAGQSEKG
jgi:hypothetical protein